MPLRETEAIVLRSFPLGEADRLVSFLGRSTGRLRGVARGARRPKSRFGSTLEPLSYIRIWFYERETRELVRINQCELLESFLEAQRDYSAGVALGLVSEVTEAVLGEREAAEANFRLVLLTARTIQRIGKVPLALAYFALWTVRLGGWLPSLERCARCGRAFTATESAFGSERLAGLVCGDCRLPGLRGVTAKALELARAMIGQKLEHLVEQSWPEAAVGEVSGYMLDLIEQQIERKLNSRMMLEPKI